MKKIYLCTAIAMTLLTACQENETLVTVTPTETNDTEVIISATIDESATRTHLSESDEGLRHVLWDASDNVAVFYGYDKPSKFTVKSGANSTNAQFSTRKIEKGTAAIGHYVGLYPYDADATIEAKTVSNYTTYTVTTTFPAEQTYAENTYGVGAAPMMAIAEKGSDLDFKNVAATIKLQLKGAATISKIVVSTSTGKKLAGACTYTMGIDGSAPVIEFAEDAATTITLNCGEGVQLKENEATNFMFTLPPMDMDDNELLFHVYNKEDGVYTEIKKETGWDYKRSKITAVGPYTYEMPVYAASINGKPYDNVEAAFDDFETGNITEATMNLKKDIVLGTAPNAANSLSRTTSTEEGDLTKPLRKESITIPAGKTLTLNLNGHSIRGEKECDKSFQMIDNKGTLIITGNGTISFKDTSAGDPNFGWGSYTIRNEGTLIVENGTIEHLGEQNKEYIRHMYCSIWQYSGSTTINGGTFSNPYYRSVRLWKGDMTINGGNFEGQLWVQADYNTSKLTINGGTFAPRGNDGSSVFITNTSNQHTVDFAVTGGYFNTKIGSSNTTNFAEGSGMITGGTFTEPAKTNTNEALLATGYQFVANGDGSYDVKK